MSALHNTFIDIARILDDQSDFDVLKNKLSDPNYNFDKLVQVGSNQLVLPAIYCKLKEKKLLKVIPAELTNYLDELTTINRNRNKTILSEVKAISKLFQDEGINHSFLKGTSLLAAGFYKDAGERMIGDIDILVDRNQLETAQALLMKDDYEPVKVTFGSKYFEHKHLPRLIPRNKLAAVEIHRKLIHKQIKHEVSPKDYLQNSTITNGVFTGKQSDVFWHTALNFQINDYGHFYNYLGLRSAYDILILKNELDLEEYKNLSSKKDVYLLINMMSLYFDSIEYLHKGLVSKFLFSSYKWKQQNNWFRKTCFTIQKTFFIFNILSNRTFYFITNSSYRKDCIKDYRRITSILKNKLDSHNT